MRLIFWPLLLLPAALLSQSPLIGSLDARSRAAGGTALAARGLPALWTNPAGLAGEPDPEAGAYYEQRFGVAELGLAAAGVTHSGFGLQVAALSLDGYGEYRLGVAYGRALTGRLRLGVQVGGLGVYARGYGQRLRPLLGAGLQYDLGTSITLATAILGGASPDERINRIEVGARWTVSSSVSFAAEGTLLAGGEVRTRFGVVYSPQEEVHFRLGVAPGRREATFGAGYFLSEKLETTVFAAVHERLGVSPGIGLYLRP